MNGRPVWEKVSALVQAELQRAGVPGCSYALVNAEGMLDSGGWGLADIRLPRPATARTVYHLFSATKLYTATALMQLVEAGKLRLDMPFVEILPEYRRPELQTITLSHLLTHTSGIADTMKAVSRVRRAGAAGPSTAEALKRYQMKPACEPGMKVHYVNVGYAILGEVITRAAGEAYCEYVQTHILQPLGIEAAFTHSAAMLAESATAYMNAWEPMRWMLSLMPEVSWALGERVGRYLALKPYDLDTAAIGGLAGSPLGLAPFLVANLNEGRGILRPETCRQMQSLIANGQAGFEAKLGMGLGWKIGAGFINHEGGGAGYATETRLYPAKKLGILLMMNYSGVKSHRAAHAICEAIAREF